MKIPMNPLSRLRALFQRRALKQEIDEELQFHIEQRTAENLATGVAPEEAVREARKRFGNMQAVREQCRETRGASFGETTLQDLRFGARMLGKNPGFTFVAMLTLALGIGANTAIFSVMDKLLVRPLPVTEPQRLALVAQGERNAQLEFDFTYPLFLDYQRNNTVFRHLTVTMDESVGLGTGGATERQRALLVSGNYFAMLDVNAALGRTFAPDEGVESDDAAVVVLSYGLWQRSFGADPQVIGRNVTVNGRSFMVVGVAPREFTGTTRGVVPDLYLPITIFGQLTTERPGGENPLASRYYSRPWVMGRLKDGITLRQAEEAMDLLAQQAHAAGIPNASAHLAILAGGEGFTQDLRDARLPLRLLLGTAGLVLLIACANLANLQLARATTRTRDFAIRLALGATRGRLLRKLLTESVLLALLGGVLGMLVAAWLINVLGQFRPPNANREIAAGLDLRVLLFALGASVFTGVLFGLAPAWRSSRPQLVNELKGGGGTTEPRGRTWNLRGTLVVLQIALSLLVLVSAGLCVRSLRNLQQVDPGFEPSKVLLASFNLGLNNYQPSPTKDFYDHLLERVRTLPGVESASLARATPLDGNRMAMSIERVEGYENRGRVRPFADLNLVSSDYFRTFGVPLLSGRDFNTTDAGEGVNTVIVNEAFVHRYLPGQEALGKRLYNGSGEKSGKEVWEIVGVARNVASRELQTAPQPAMFRPLLQWPEKSLTLSLRTGFDSSATVAALRGIVKSLDNNVPIFGIRTLEQQKDGSLALQRMTAMLLGGFGALALLLAALGIYGVLAYSVSRQTREIGVRMALGAQVSDVLRLVLRQGLGLAGIGLVLGLGGALAMTRLLRSFLYEVTPLDPLIFAIVFALLASVSLLACWLPARRATKVDPMVALRHE
jgi:predicted permease